MSESGAKVDKKEFELPKTTFSRDIETRVIQVIIAHCLGEIEDVAPLGGNLIDTLFGRSDGEKVKGIHVEQDSKNHQVKVKVEINVAYGTAIPEKSVEVQEHIVEAITQMTGLHVASVHVVVKGLISNKDEAPETMVEEKAEKDEGETYAAKLLKDEVEELVEC